MARSAVFRARDHRFDLDDRRSVPRGAVVLGVAAMSPCHCSTSRPPFVAVRLPAEHYFVVCLDYGTAGREAIMDPTIDREEVLARLKSREYKNVSFIHHIHDGVVEDVTLQLIGEARNLVFA